MYKRHDVKNMVAILVGVNMDGYDKLPLIGKSTKPRCFKSVKSLPVHYKGNKNFMDDQSDFKK